MVEEEKDVSPEAEIGEKLSEDSTEEQQTAAEEATERRQIPEAATLAQRRGRIIARGLVTAVIVSLIVVFVAGIFQFSSKWLKPCPMELPVNDPSPKLWQEMVSQGVTNQRLGVPEEVRAKAQFKKSTPVTKESDTDTKANQLK